MMMMGLAAAACLCLLVIAVGAYFYLNPSGSPASVGSSALPGTPSSVPGAPKSSPAPGPAPAPRGLAAYTRQPQVGDWWGNDLGSYPTSDPATCATNCDDNNGCVAFVTATDSQNCWLKSRLDPAQNHPSAASVRQYYTKPGVVFPPT